MYLVNKDYYYYWVGWVHTSHNMGLVGFMLQWVGLGWIDENGPTSNSAPSRKFRVAVQVATCMGRGHIVAAPLQAAQLTTIQNH